MPYKNPKKDRNYKHEWKLEQERDEKDERATRARARRKMDGKCKKGQDVSHNKALAKGGTNKDGVKCESKSSNRARGGAMSKPYTKTKKRKKS